LWQSDQTLIASSMAMDADRVIVPTHVVDRLLGGVPEAVGAIVEWSRSAAPTVGQLVTASTHYQRLPLLVRRRW
jgi:hypothetical protein